MQIAISTVFRSTNYGATLQAYALSYAVQKISGKTCYFIDYRRQKTINMFRFSIFDMDIEARKRITKNAIKRTCRQCLNPSGTFVRNRVFEKFRAEHLSISKEVYYRSKNIKLYDTQMLILGSDQIWNPDITDGFNDVYFGKIGSPDIPTASYAASLGKTSFNENETAELKEMLKNVDIISVREEESISLLNQLTEKTVSCVPDPTVLIEREHWEKLAIRTSACKRKYVLVYMLTFNDRLIELAKRMADIFSCEIILLGDGSKRKICGIKQKRTYGPKEFIGCILNAEYVLTNSFHGTIFSVIFNKQFYTVPHETRGIRMINFAQKVGLEDRIIYTNDSVSTESIVEQIDYKSVNKKLQELRQVGLSYLKSILIKGCNGQV